MHIPPALAPRIYHVRPTPDRMVRVYADLAWLEVWSDLAPLPELRAALPAAVRLARLARCESWLRCYAGMNETELAEWGDAAAFWLAGVADG